MAEYVLPVVLADDEDLAKGAGLAAAAAGVAYGSYRLGKYIGQQFMKKTKKRPGVPNGPAPKFRRAGGPRRKTQVDVSVI